MKHYIEITLIENSDINLFSLWSKVYQQLHLGLVEMQNDQKQVPMGISFPEYKFGDKFSLLGGKCRLFAQDEATLAQFNAAKWLSRLSDYVHCTSIRPVPDKITGYATYQRVQPKTNKERLARRYAKRHQISYHDALQHYGDMPQLSIPIPFIRLNSLSSEQIFCLWIKKTLVSEALGTYFSSYGLSSKSTVPEF